MATTTNFGWTTPNDTDLVKDGAAAIRTLGSSIDTSLLDLKGGTTGQILAKASNTDLDYAWITNDVGDITAVTAGTGITGGGSSGAVTITNDMATTITTNGDLLYGTGSGTYTRRGIGSTGQVLTVAGGVPTWSTPASGGKVLQVVQGTVTSDFTTTSSSNTDTGLTVTITPTSASSKILVLVSIPSAKTLNTVVAATNNYSQFVLKRGTTELQAMLIGYFGLAASNYPQIYQSISGSYLDSPATTSATTYKMQARIDASTNVAFNGSAGTINSIVVMEIGA
jgi:hypothetical protein